MSALSSEDDIESILLSSTLKGNPYSYSSSEHKHFFQERHRSSVLEIILPFARAAEIRLLLHRTLPLKAFSQSHRSARLKGKRRGRGWKAGKLKAAAGPGLREASTVTSAAVTVTRAFL